MMSKKKALGLVLVAGLVVDLAKIISVRGIKKENDRELLEEASLAVYSGCVSSKTDWEVYTFGENEIRIKYNPYVSTMLNMPGSVAIAFTAGDEHFAFYENKFRKLSPECKRAVMAHELAHSINKDVMTKTYVLERIINVLKGKVLPIELAADKFAVEQVGKKAVINMLRNLKTPTNIIGNKEIDLRIKAIKNM